MVRVATFVFALAAGVAAQAADPERLRTNLGGTAARDVAWAAHETRASKHKELIAPVQRALGTWRRKSSDDAEARVVCLHLLDALVALDAKVPAGELLDLVEGDLCGAAAFALLAREAHTNQAELTTLFRRDFPLLRPELTLQRDRRTIAIGELLAKQAPPGFADIVAPACNFTLRVTVLEPGKKRTKPPRSAPIAMRDTSAREPEESWPPQPAYWIEHPTLQRTDVERVRIHPDVRQWVTRQDTPPTKDSRWSFQLPEIAHDELPYLPDPMRLLQKAAKSKLRPVVEATIQWTDDARFVAEATAARDRLQASVEEMRKNLVANGALRAEDATKLLPTRIQVLVDDERVNPKTALPELPSPKQ